MPAAGACVIVLASIFLCGVFSGIESGFYGLNAIRLLHRRRMGDAAARALWDLRSAPEAAIAAMLVGTNAATFLASYVSTIGLGSELLATALVTPPLFFFGELLPKALFYRGADSIMYRVAGFAGAWVWFLRAGLVLPAIGIVSRLVSRAAGAGPGERPMECSRPALYEMLGEKRARLSAAHRGIVLAAMEMSGATVSRYMRPAGKTVTVRPEATVGEALEAMRRSNRSRIPLVEPASGMPVGIVSFFDAAAAAAGARCSDIMRPVASFPADTPCCEALERMKRERQILAAVVEKDGRMIGIVSMEDMARAIIESLPARSRPQPRRSDRMPAHPVPGGMLQGRPPEPPPRE
ncbi:MAG: CNNM domain-containing protein [Planctomycetota bacterium]|nr:CNNM domain-containing protein [Planctomycetota bacterium]